MEEALGWAGGRRTAELRIADIGAGSGALAICLARRLGQSRVVAVDVSPAALQVARSNIARYGLQERISLVCGDLLTPLAAAFDLVVANLPYVARDELATLQADVAAYEPSLALDGGAGGLELITRIIEQAAEGLRCPGLMLLEIDSRQADRVVRLAEALPRVCVSVLRDLAGLERVVRVERR